MLVEKFKCANPKCRKLVVRKKTTRPWSRKKYCSTKCSNLASRKDRVLWCAGFSL